MYYGIILGKLACLFIIITLLKGTFNAMAEKKGGVFVSINKAFGIIHRPLGLLAILFILIHAFSLLDAMSALPLATLTGFLALMAAIVSVVPYINRNKADATDKTWVKQHRLFSLAAFALAVIHVILA